MGSRDGDPDQGVDAEHRVLIRQTDGKIDTLPLSPKVISYARFSPEGQKLAYIQLSYPRDWLPRVCILDIASGAVREITPAGKNERVIKWSGPQSPSGFAAPPQTHY